MDRATTTGTIAAPRRRRPTAASTADDFIALPVQPPRLRDARPTSSAATTASTGRSCSMIGRDQLKEHMAVYGNRLAPDDALWEALTGCCPRPR